jgi:hypothetical protein
MATVLLQPANPGIYPDYTALQAGILNWVQREDLAAHAPAFIEMAERTMFRELPLRATETSFSGITSGDTITLPAVLNAIESIEISANGRSYALDYTPGAEQCQLSGQPERYTMQNGVLRLFPSPAGAYGYTVYYMPTPAFLSAVNQSNALLVAHPDIYLWGALTELARFIMDAQLEASYLNAYKSALSSIQRADERRRFPIAGGMQIKPRGRR